VSIDPRQSTFDRDLDIPGPAPSWPEFDDIRPYYRLVANPFLMILGWLMAVGVCRLAFQWRRPMVAVFALGLFLASCLLFQFHCLDCGKTYFLHRRRRHRCEAVWVRWNHREHDRWQPPAIKTQLVIWFYFIMSAIALTATMLRKR
jgi:hypothetical protein